MGFLGVYKAIYDYEPRDDGELAISEGDLLYVLEKNDDDGWWKAKKKAGPDEDDEPTGLVPNNYVEQADVISQARTIYEYTRQTEEELSFPEDAVLQIFDTSDPDWILAGHEDEFGFVPSNYIDLGEDGTVQAEEDEVADEPAPSLPKRPEIPVASPEPSSPAAPTSNPVAAALANAMKDRAATQASSPPPTRSARPTVQFEEPPASDDELERSPALPSRPRPQHSASSSNDYSEPPQRRPVPAPQSESNQRTPGGFHMYNISEMVSVMGKRKKMPTTLGINLGTGTILIAPERAQDAPPQEWTADKMTHYSREGKHVFMELVRPSKSIDFHAGAKDTAEEIVAALGELSGAVKAEGLREVILAGTTPNQRKGTVLYDFMAQGDDEVTVAAGDDVVILDDSKSDEWWQVRRLKNGKEGVVPSSYVEITGTITPPPGGAGPSSGKSTIEQNRMEEIRLTKEAMKASKEPQEVGPGMPLQKRGSSLGSSADSNNPGQQRRRRENGRNENGHSRSKSKPDVAKVRTWTDRSKSFSVEAQFLGLKDGKIHLHKMNGVKIAVPIAKMSHEDLVFVESLTGISLDDERPLADMKRKAASKPSEDVGARIERSQKPEYDWFQFFLSCDVAVGLCERYAQSFLKDSMDESVLPDVDANILRTLGIREGDIIKVMRHLDSKFGRDRSKPSNDGEGSSGGLFSGPGGALRNNTRKGRPAPTVQTSDVVDADAFSKRDGTSPAPAGDTSPNPVQAQARKPTGGFDDDAWDVKPSSKPQPERKETPNKVEPVAPKPIPPALTGSMQELSLLSEPLQPSKVEVQPTASDKQPDATIPAAAQQPTGATPSFFSTVPPPGSSPKSLARQRPTPSSVSPNQGSLIPPPPQRPLSAPFQQSAHQPPALAPQMTGLVQGRPAPPGQSLNDISQARLQQQYAAQMQQMQQMQPAMTGYQIQPQSTGMQYPMATGTQFMQPMYTGMPNQSPFQDPGRPSQLSPIQTQPTGFAGSFPQQQQFGQQQQPGNVNNYLPPALEPQRTGMPNMQQLQPTGYNNSFGQTPQPPQPLQPQKTGPAPPVRFGVTGEANKLTPQATGRRANLSQATPQNPFGF